MNADELQDEISSLRTVLAEVTAERDAARDRIARVREWATHLTEYGTSADRNFHAVAALNNAGEEALKIVGQA